ncbi:MAG: DUF2199 domain-containing protein [Williamsia sp.]|nr:DUF2199 domain-containing protein [Williamsia sp.]
MKLFSLFRKKTKTFPYKCSCCGKIYDTAPLCFGTDFPDYYLSIPPQEREQRIELQQSLCVVDKEQFFHRGRLTISVINNAENLIFDVWTSISKKNFETRVNLWEDPLRTDHEPYFGWLQTIVPAYGNTLNIKTIATEQSVGLIPEIRIIEEGHQLKVDQDNGITYERALEIVDKILQDQHQKN